MPVLQPLGQGMPNLLALVNLALAECNQPKIASIKNAKPIVDGMVDAINDAIVDIYTRAKWNFLHAQAPIDMQSGVQDYPVPADFGYVTNDIIIGDKKITFYPYEQFAIWSGVQGDLTTFTLVQPDTLRFCPVPSDDFVAQWPQIMLNYTRRPVLVSNDEDVPNLPKEFKEALRLAATMRWKKTKEYSPVDIQTDKQSYEQCIVSKLASYLRDPSRTHGLQRRINYVPRFNTRGF